MVRETVETVVQNWRTVSRWASDVPPGSKENGGRSKNPCFMVLISFIPQKNS